MDVRPLRLYKHTFVQGQTRLEFVRVGNSPCAAKRKAFEALEAELVIRPELPKNGWRLLQQEDVTALIVRPPG